MIHRLALLLILAGPAAAKAPFRPPDAERVCVKDADCSVVRLTCLCMYCARPGDLEAGIVTAVNGRHAKKYAHRSKCSAKETAACALAGACPVTGESLPVCRAKRCTIEFKPR